MQTHHTIRFAGGQHCACRRHTHRRSYKVTWSYVVISLQRRRLFCLRPATGGIKQRCCWSVFPSVRLSYAVRSKTAHLRVVWETPSRAYWPAWRCDHNGNEVVIGAKLPSVAYRFVARYLVILKCALKCSLSHNASLTSCSHGQSVRYTLYVEA